MHSWSGELQPFLGEAEASLGWRYVKTAWRLLRSEPGLIALAVLCGLVNCGIEAAVVALDLSGIVAFTVVTAVGCSVLVTTAVAVAFAVDSAVDGVPLGPGEALREATERSGAILGWAALMVGVFLCWRLAGAIGGTGLVIAVLLLSACLFVAAFFVAPSIALDGLGPLEAFRESTDLVRERWRAVIGGMVGLIACAVVPSTLLWLAFEHALAARRLHGAGPALGLAILAATVVLTAVISVTRGIYATLLFREALGDLPAGVYLGPRRNRGQRGLRAVGGVIAALFVIGLVSSATKHDRMVNHQGPGSYYIVQVPDSAATVLASGSPVLYEDHKIGTVLEVDESALGSKVSLHLDPGFTPEETPGTFYVTETFGEACLTLVPSTAAPAGNAQAL